MIVCVNVPMSSNMRTPIKQNLRTRRTPIIEPWLGPCRTSMMALLRKYLVFTLAIKVMMTMVIYFTLMFKPLSRLEMSELGENMHQGILRTQPYI